MFWNIHNIKPRDPVALGLCARDDLSAAIDKARRAAERVAQRKAKADLAAGIIPEPPPEPEPEPEPEPTPAPPAATKPPAELTVEDVFGTPKPSEPDPTGGASDPTP